MAQKTERKKRSPLLKKVTYEQTEEEKREKYSVKEFKPFFKYFLKYKGLLFFAGFGMLFSVAVGIVNPILSGKLLSTFTTNFVVNDIIKYALAILILTVVYSIYQYFADRLWNFLQLSVATDLKRDLIDRINLLKSENFDKHGSGTFSMVLNGDVYRLSMFPLQFMDSFSAILSKLGFLGYTFSLDWRIGLFMLGHIGIVLGLSFWRVNIRKNNRKVLRKISEKNFSLQQENLRGMRDIKGLNTTNNIIQSLDNGETYYNSVTYKLYNKANFVQGLIRATKALLNFAFVGLCVYLLLNNQIEIAAFMIAYNFRSSIQSFATTIISLKDMLVDYTFSAKKINDLYNEEVYPVEQYGDLTLENVKGEIQFKGVKFEYVKDSPVLKDVDFTIPANSMVSFVGKSGSGKSTIISLLNKLYTLNKDCGTISLDGVNINDLTRNSLRDNICIVSQNPYIFDMSVRENLLLAKPTATEEELISALTKAEIYDFIETLPEKLDAKLGENGIKLSGGQKQRLAIARALLKDARVLVFDEATSALDNISQEKIKAVIGNLKGSHTIIVIAHRLNTVVDSDKIIYLEDGVICAEGSHEWLMENSIKYNNLYKSEDELN